MKGGNTSGLSRSGRGRTQNGRVYSGCLPCGQGHWAADIEHANIWIENHWRRCRGPLSHGDREATESPVSAGRAAA